MAGCRRDRGHPGRHQLRHPRRSPRSQDQPGPLNHAVSRVSIVPPTEAIAHHASKLLAAAGLHGHKYALDALVAATALTAPAPVTVLTSDPEDLLMLCGTGVHISKI